MNKQAISKKDKKVLSCFFLADVLCSFRKSEHSAVMERCCRCTHFKRFEREMDEEEDDFFAYADLVQKYGYDIADRMYR